MKVSDLVARDWPTLMAFAAAGKRVEDRHVFELMQRGPIPEDAAIWLVDWIKHKDDPRPAHRPAKPYETKMRQLAEARRLVDEYDARMATGETLAQITHRKKSMRSEYYSARTRVKKHNEAMAELTDLFRRHVELAVQKHGAS